MKAYKNKRRSTGSQSETPTIKITQSPLTVRMGGYQSFTLTKSAVKAQKYSGKFTFIKNFLQQHAAECQSVADLGCSNGLTCFMAQQCGYQRIHALDHDLQCMAVINKAKDALGCSNIIATQYSFGDNLEPVDVMIMGALIHWVYSCTALYGNFDQISEYLRKHVNKVLLIEWVSPGDGAIKFFKHTSYNKNIIKEPYTKENFVKSLKKYFTTVEKVYKVTSTRILYIATV